MKTKSLLTVAAGVALLASLAANAGPRDNYETPDYKVLRNDGAFEIRDYPAMVIASAPMPEDGADRNGAFMSLFRYISGQNEKDQKIAMTTPVITRMEGTNRTMSFVVPKDVAKAGAPEADNEAIHISRRAAGRFAVYRYSGRWTTAREQAARAKLLAWIADENLEVLDTVEKANYDPPFTLPMFRRNEVMVRIKP